ncbi:Uncharacterised protein [Klebsiella pneumoniae]|nr:Uncharacterised protein [Klebsiella pneumoniae]
MSLLSFSFFALIFDKAIQQLIGFVLVTFRFSLLTDNLWY